jgi:hypothetical protein
MDTLKVILFVIIIGGALIYAIKHSPAILESLNLSDFLKFEYQKGAGFSGAGAIPTIQNIGPRAEIFSVNPIKLVSNASGELNFTGWKIKSAKGEMEILKGVEIYNPDGSVMGDIKLKTGQTLTIYSTTNLLGINMRLNKCLLAANLANFNLPTDYRSCFALHSHDNDFLLSEWIIWLGRDIVGSSPGKISLYDKSGNLIDEYAY